MHATIYYIRFDHQLAIHRFTELLSRLPGQMAERIKRYRRWQDAHAALYGKLLLQQALDDHDLALSLQDLKWSAYQRPYFEHPGFDFNISHSGEYVLCAFSLYGRLGVDVEAIRPLDITDFRNLFTTHEWHQIEKAPNTLQAFFDHWTRKEAIVKADGRGLSAPLLNVPTSEKTCKVEHQTWHLSPLSLEGDYKACLASSQAITSLAWAYADFNKSKYKTLKLKALIH